ncbi:PilL N-terminal domain-containing protein [Pseudomonas sp. NBRC 100443]|uniref:PFGI-1 class ICE element type IV pilus protein PilL2 n=1 Tax=Pseudomonas sp. NBRC 100443 TaxID=1113665 RepID=UPI0024A2E55E|nr:PilL N-terminal domain-containing protein [Pseudomonas sp. NBRC 100443]GLU39185.1 hypothetical protein Pssp01_32780 [Pseudomonas sp. NBRC 100443]
MSTTQYIYRSALLLAALVSGCSASSPPSAPAPVATTEQVPRQIPVERYGRYSLVELAPTAAQQDLLQQVVDLSIPDTLHASVGDGLRHALLRSGYQLCNTSETHLLDSLPLPAPHYHLGPLPLREALLTLVGPAWSMHADDSTRHVCFTHANHSGIPAAPVTPSAPSASAMETQP